MPSLPTLPNDFVALPLLRPPTKSYPKQTTHYLYLKPNAPRIPTNTTTRELFLSNLPIDTTPSKLKSLFAKQLGQVRVEEITLLALPPPQTLGITKPAAPPPTKKRKISPLDTPDSATPSQTSGILPSPWDTPILPSGSTAIIRFIDDASLHLAWKTVRKLSRRYPQTTTITWDGEETLGGTTRYLAHQSLRFPDRAVLKGVVDEYMGVYEEGEKARAREEARRRREPDEDGFVTVVRGGRNGVAREEGERGKGKEKVGGDFYRFQNREKRKEVARDLVRGFEEDARRVEEMRRRKGRVRPEA